MSRIRQIKEAVKKTKMGPALQKRYWKMRKNKKLMKALYRTGILEDPPKAKDRLLFETLPAHYNKFRNQPIDENKVIFVEARIDRIGNSFEYLYKMLSEQYTFDIHVHFLRETFVPYDIYVENCKKMLEDVATARYVFLSEASNVISCIDKRPETIVTQLWHACGAFKRFGMSTAEYIFGLDAEQQRRHPFYRNFTYVTVSSPEIIWAYEEAMDLKGHDETKILPLGTSRTDAFFDQKRIDEAYKKLYEFFPAARGKKVILFAPTFRGRIVSAKTATRFSPWEFYQALSDEYVLITKHHPMVRKRPAIPGEMQDSFMIDATDTMSIEDLLSVSDICISDYSSLVFEYSLFEKPMIFFAYDLSDYFDWRGFYYDYYELAPGPICRSHYEMIDYIKHLDERFDRQKVRDFRDRFMSACDGHVNERILDLVFGQEVLEKKKKNR